MTRTTLPILPPTPSTIQTPRLPLRPFSLTELSHYVLLRRQPKVMKWSSASRCDETTSQTEEWMARFLPREEPRTFNFSIEELEKPGAVVGSAGVSLKPGKQPEIGYMFRKEVWGKGYATEALKAVLHAYWALERRELDIETDVESERKSEQIDGKQERETKLASVARDGDAAVFQVETLIATTEVANGASRKLLEKFGFVQVRQYPDLEAGGKECMDYILQQPGT